MGSWTNRISNRLQRSFEHFMRFTSVGLFQAYILQGKSQSNYRRHLLRSLLSCSIIYYLVIYAYGQNMHTPTNTLNFLQFSDVRTNIPLACPSIFNSKHVHSDHVHHVRRVIHGQISISLPCRAIRCRSMPCTFRSIFYRLHSLFIDILYISFI